MTRQFKTIADAVPKLMAFDRYDPHGVTVCKGFTAADTAQLMRMYARARYQLERPLSLIENTKAHRAIEAIERKMKKWEKLG